MTDTVPRTRDNGPSPPNGGIATVDERRGLSKVVYYVMLGLAGLLILYGIAAIVGLPVPR